MQKILVVVLTATLAWIQFQLWFNKGGIHDSQTLQSKIRFQLVINTALNERNNQVKDKIQELKGSQELMEFRARRDMNLVKPNETLVYFPNPNDN